MIKSIFIKIYIIPIIIFSPLIIISCNSWFSIWIIIELNLIRFIPLIIFFNKFYKELSIKYFIIQAIRSSLLIISSNLLFININNFKLIIILMINFSLLIKIGSPPFHNWFINIINNINWINCFILSTWQKIIPIISIILLFNKYLIYFITIISSILRAIIGLNHQSIRIIISYSSINHIRWIFINLIIRELIWTYYFLSYLIINLSIILIFHKINIFFINQLNLTKINYNTKLIILINFFSISGLPPIFGFSIKWISIYFINLIFFKIILLILIIISILTFTFYIRICINIILNFKLFNKTILINKFINFNSSTNIIIFTFFFNLWIIRIWIF